MLGRNAVDKIGRDLQDTLKRVLREYAETLFLALLLALLLRVFVVSAYRISNASMVPAMRVGDFIMGYKLPYGFTIPFTDTKVGQPKPKRNEVLIFKCPGDPTVNCVKRVIGLPGDRIQIIKKKLFLNGMLARYSPLSKKEAAEIVNDLFQKPKDYALLREQIGIMARDIFITGANLGEKYGPLIVPPGHFFVLSDNRDGSEDSRQWGVIPVKSIEARALFVWFSIDWSPTLNGAGPRIRFDRIFHPVH